MDRKETHPLQGSRLQAVVRKESKEDVEVNLNVKAETLSKTRKVDSALIKNQSALGK